jgi:glycerol-3-phosphate dehydrogenase (NAD(P)+)
VSADRHTGSRVAVLGGGAWGTALALQMQRAGHAVKLWARDPEAAAALRAGGNPRYLPGLAVEPVDAHTDAGTVLRDATHVLSVVPAQALRAALATVAPHMPADAVLVLCAKGIERATGQLLSSIVADVLPENPVAALSGPSFAADVARGLPTAVVLASRDLLLSQKLALLFSTEKFRCYSSGDLTGVELGGALKNVFALAAGAVSGAGLGASAQAAMVTRGFVELRRVAQNFGARPETLMGLSGLGDLMLTCSSTQSRNFAYGAAIGRGAPLEGLALAEGVPTASIAADLARARGIEVPIIDAVDMLLARRISIGEAVSSLMSRPLRCEDD